MTKMGKQCQVAEQEKKEKKNSRHVTFGAGDSLCRVAEPSFFFFPS